MRAHFATTDAAKAEWTKLVDEHGLLMEGRAQAVLLEQFVERGVEEVLIEVQRKWGTSCSLPKSSPISEARSAAATSESPIVSSQSSPKWQSTAWEEVGKRPNRHNRPRPCVRPIQLLLPMTRHSSARELLKDVVARYRAIGSYADTGMVQALDRPKSSPMSFETAFRRPDDFRFRFSSPHPYGPKRHLVSRSQIGMDAGKPYYWSQHYSSPPELEQQESLQMAVAGATGVSRGSAFTIWSLLFGEEGQDLFSMLARPRLRKFACIDGVRCHRVTATHRGLHRIDVYIGVDDLLLRGCVRRSGRFPHAEMRTNIEVGLEFSASHFTVADAPTAPSR